MRDSHLLSLLGLVLLASSGLAAPPSAEIEFFEKHVRPVLVEKCFSCHGTKLQRGGLRVDSRQALLTGGDSGPALVPGQPDRSLLLRAVRHEGDLKMPPKQTDRLTAPAVAALETWIRNGAPWPAETTNKAALSSIALARQKHWAFKPIVRPAVPVLAESTWANNPIDHFILARLGSKNLSPSPAASRLTLIRRLTFDLTGLPPTPEQVEAFVNDPRPDAYERLVDRLLASPTYGERWGRHWLDVARYADTKGYVFQEERRYPYAYTYRDYVVNALNEDLPYDQFLIHQLAADHVVRQNPQQSPRILAAMGFLTLGRRFLNNIHDIIDDRIDVVSRGLMGLTVSCARCHDHKFDPIPSRDYYSLYGVFASSIEPKDLPALEPESAPGNSAFDRELARLQARLDEYRQAEHAKLLKTFRSQVGDYLLAVAEIDLPSGTPRQSTADLSRPLVQRWRPYLAQKSKTHHPILAPWFAFARLPRSEFATKAADVAARIAANNEPDKPIDPLVAQAFAGKPPATLAEVANRYNKLFEKALQAKADDRGSEAIRQFLLAAELPANVPLAEADRYFNRAQRNQLNQLQQRLDRHRASGGGQPRAMVLVDAPNPVNPRVLVRGNPGNPGVAVPRQFLEVLAPDRKPFTQGSGRLELAQAIASKDNPLTARVLVNRVWMHHFGKPLVATPGDFGVQSEPPTHPELLDWLADEFLRSGWSLKSLHRLIVCSATYRQASDDRADGLTADPENTLLWRYNRRRLEFEPLRDALLAVSGQLDLRMGGPAVDITTGIGSPRRSIYGFIDRQNLPGLFRTFDLASPDSSTPRRHATTVPQQSLFLMNSPMVQHMARQFVARAEVQEQPSDEARVAAMIRLAYARPAEPEEIELGLQFIRSADAGAGLNGWQQYAQVLLLANEFSFVD